MSPLIFVIFCGQIKDLINFRTFKFCVKRIPKNIVKSLDKYLRDELKKYEPFFYFVNNKVCINLDNPLLNNMESVRNVEN